MQPFHILLLLLLRSHLSVMPSSILLKVIHTLGRGARVYIARAERAY